MQMDPSVQDMPADEVIHVSAATDNVCQGIQNTHTDYSSEAHSTGDFEQEANNDNVNANAMECDPCLEVRRNCEASDEMFRHSVDVGADIVPQYIPEAPPANAQLTVEPESDQTSSIAPQTRFESPFKFFDHGHALRLHVTCRLSMLNTSFWTPWFGPPNLSIFATIGNQAGSELISTPTAGVLSLVSPEKQSSGFSSDFNSLQTFISDPGKAQI
jgi:hypothetical protein